MFNKRVLKKAVDELNKAKKPAKPKDIIVDPKGQWAHPGQVTRIPSNKITMQGVGYPVLGVPNKGQPKIMMPGQYFEFPEADYVDEYPQMQDGGQIYTYAKRPGSYYKKDSKGNWMIKNESTHGKYVAIDDPKGTRSKVLNAQAKPLQKAPKAKPQSQYDNVVYDSTLQPGESTAVRNIIQEKIPDVIGKDAMTYLKEQKQKKEKAINKNIRAKNEKVKEFYKEYHESPRYQEMLQKSAPNDWEDYYFGRELNLEGYPDPKTAPKVHIRHKQPKDKPGTGGFSRNETGDITVLPRGFNVKGLLPHEWSHSTDRPIAYDNPFSGKPFAFRMGRVIPIKDSQWITKHKPKTWLESPEYKRKGAELKRIYKKYPDLIANSEEFMNYVGEPTETRARLNDIRFQAKQKGIYDPFTEKVTPAILNKLLKTRFEDSFKTEGFDALQQLRDVYTDEEIQWMLNNISKNQQAEEEGAQSFGRYGGQFQDGGDLDSEVDLTVLPEDGRSYYDPILDQMYLNPFADKEEINHELTHAWQNRTGALRSDPLSPKMRPPAAVTDEQAATYFNRKGDDVQYYLDNLQSIYPEMTGNIWTPDMSAFIPEEVQYNRAIDPLMYYDPATMEGEAEMMSQRFGPPPLEITYQEGGGVPQYAPGGSTGCPPGSYWDGKRCVKITNTPPTFADSLALYKNALKISGHYHNLRKKGFYDEVDLSRLFKVNPEGDVMNFSPMDAAYADALKKETIKYYQSLLKKGLNYQSDFEDYKRTYPKATEKDYINDIKKSLAQTRSSTKDKIYYKDLYPSQIDPKAPAGLIDVRIAPQYSIVYRDPLNPPAGGTITGTYQYDPLAIKPASLLSDTEIIRRFKKFGKSGIPESRLKRLGLLESDKKESVKPKPDTKKDSKPTVKENIVVKPLPKDTIQVGEKEVISIDEKTGEVRKVIEPIYEERPVIDKLPIKQALIDHPKGTLMTESKTTPEKVTEEADIEYTPEYSEEGSPDSIGYHYKDKQKRYIDWNGRSIGFNLPRFRKPGHGGDLIKKGERRYIHLPTIETRTEDWFEADNDNEEYQDGGQYRTKLTPEEEFDFQSFYRTLPDNLQTDDDTYDIRGYWDSEGRPEAFNYDQPTEDDGYYHAYSINQNTGEYLKSPAHDTFQHAVDEDRKIGYRPITNIQGRNIAVENQSIADPEEQSYLRNMEGPANYIELDLTPEEIQEYAKGGYIIEDISVPSLTKAKKGGIFGRRKRRKEKEAQQQQPQYVAPVEVDDELYESVTPYVGAPEDFKKGVGNIKEVGVAAKAPDWLKFSREYENKNSRQAFIDKKKRDYLNNTNKGLAKAAGLNMENFPEQVERNFANEYDYKKNSYIMKKLSKSKGFSLKRRGEWVDELTKPERQILADSKYEGKLQPSLWARTNAGLRTLYDQIKGKQYSPVGKREKYEGMTAKESKDIQDSGLLGALNVFAGAEAPGYWMANLINKTGNLSYGSGYRKDTDLDQWGEVEAMSRVNPLQAAIVNPVNYVLPYELMTLGAAGAAGLRNLFTKPATEGVVGELATVRPALTAGAEEATVARLNKPTRLMDVREVDPNAYRQVASGTIKPETRLLPEATNRNLVIPDDANFGSPPWPDELYDKIYNANPPTEYLEPNNTFAGLTADDLDYDYITQAYKDKAMNELNASNITRRDITAPTDQFNVPPPETYYQPFDPNVAQQEIDELRRIYHTAERNLTPEEARALSQEGVGSQSDYMPENFGEDFDATDIDEYETRADANNALIEKKDKLAKIDDQISWLDDEYKSLNLDQYPTAADIPEPIAKRATEIELEITRLTDQRNAKINPPAPAQRTPAFRIVNGQVISEELAFAKDVLQQQLGLPANADMPGMIQAVSRMDRRDPVRVDFEQALIGEGLDPDDIYTEARPSSTTIRHQLPVDRVDEIAENPFAGLRGEKSKSTAEISPFVAAQIDRTIVPGTNRSVADVLGSHTNPLDAVRDVRTFVQDGVISEFSGRDIMEALREEIRKMPVTGDEKKFLIKEAKRISNAPKSQVYTGSNVTEDQAVKYISAIPEQEIQDIASQYGYTPQDVENATNRWRHNSAVYDAIINQAYDDFKYMREHNMPNPNPRAFDFQTGTPSPSLLKKGELDNLSLPKKDMDLIKKTKYDLSTRNTSGTIGYSDVDDPSVYTITDMNMIPKTEDLDDMIAAYEKAYKEASGGLKDELEMQLEDLRSTKWLRTEYVKELKAEGLNPTEIEKVTIISNSSNQKNLIKGNGEVIGTLNVGKGKLSTGESGIKIGSSGVAIRFHPYRVGSKYSKYKTWEGAQQALEKRIFDKELSTISNPADKSNPIVIKSLKKKAKTEADKVIDRLKENNNNNYGEALYRGVHNGVKDTRGSVFTRQSFAPTALEDPITGVMDVRKRAENFWGSQQRQINELGIPKAELLPPPDAFKNDPFYTQDIVIRRKLGGNTSKLNKFIR